LEGAVNTVCKNGNNTDNADNRLPPVSNSLSALKVLFLSAKSDLSVELKIGSFDYSKKKSFYKTRDKERL
jgi:hypothetical protein